MTQKRSKNWIGEEAERIRAAKLEGEDFPYTVNKEDTRALGDCTREGANYEIDCIECRKQGKIRRYYGGNQQIHLPERSIPKR